MPSMRSRLPLAFLLAASLLVAACDQAAPPTTPPDLGTPTPDDAGGGPVLIKARPVLSSKNTTENTLIAEMYGQLLEAAQIPVGRRLGLGPTDALHTAITTGDIGFYPEYTGIALTEILKEPALPDDQASTGKVRQEYEQRFQLTWLDAAPMNAAPAILTTRAIADKYGLKTLSDLPPQAAGLRLAAPGGFATQASGLPGLTKTYGSLRFKSVFSPPTGTPAQALLAGTADLAVSTRTDGAIAGQGLVVLADDKQFWPPAHVAPVVRDDTLSNYPKIKQTLNALAPRLTDAAVSALNWEVDGKGRPVADVAREFLTQQGLLKPAGSP